EEPAPERPGELGGPGAVVGVGALIDPPGIVQHGEQPNYVDIRPRLLGQAEPVLEHPRPVGDTVVTAPGKGIVFEGGVEDQGDVDRHGPLTHRLAPGIRRHQRTELGVGTTEPLCPGWCLRPRSVKRGRAPCALRTARELAGPAGAPPAPSPSRTRPGSMSSSGGSVSPCSSPWPVTLHPTD